MSFEEQLKVLKAYLLLKLEQEDWHGIRDVCVDIEVLVAKESK